MLHAWGAGLAATVLALHGWPVYLLITALGFAEAAVFLGLVLPGETALLLGGVLAAQGNISVVLLIALAIVAAIAGDSVGYEVGRRFGPSMKNSRVGRDRAGSLGSGPGRDRPPGVFCRVPRALGWRVVATMSRHDLTRRSGSDQHFPDAQHGRIHHETSQQAVPPQ